MTISELIAVLEKARELYGDLEVWGEKPRNLAKPSKIRGVSFDIMISSALDGIDMSNKRAIRLE